MMIDCKSIEGAMSVVFGFMAIAIPLAAWKLIDIFVMAFEWIRKKVEKHFEQ